ncbi:hypothetical protein NON00_12935 [Roseomonas sp. GC11]|uniref:hypothetical protein n=1 Tax=Roseomonas sp. GC11 TaxID=2950546 RepID=UPI00210938F1|nr:hypothetical protein [Roseomonas sp. GC11]MCQ4160833.1 hypothetical protein [Roseomonas sp. GC11]
MRALLERMGLASPVGRVLRPLRVHQAPASGLADGGSYQHREIRSDAPTLSRVCRIDAWTHGLSWHDVQQPLDLPDPQCPARFQPSHRAAESEERQEHMARWCATELARICPWVQCYIGPQLEDEDGGANWGAAHYCLPGQDGRGDTILVRSDLREDDVRNTFWHEAWHIIERFLSPSAMAVVDEALVRRGGAWGGASKLLTDPTKRFPHAGEFRGEYMSSHVERRARLFGLWCSLIDEGGGMVIPPMATGTRFQDWREIFEAARNGDFSRHLVEKGMVRRPE